MIGYGYYVASALASIVKHSPSDGQWYPHDFNKGSLEYYMFLLAGLMLVDAVVFPWLAVRYRYSDNEPVRRVRDYTEKSTNREEFRQNIKNPTIDSYNIIVNS